MAQRTRSMVAFGSRAKSSYRTQTDSRPRCHSVNTFTRSHSRAAAAAVIDAMYSVAPTTSGRIRRRPQECATARLSRVKWIVNILVTPDACNSRRYIGSFEESIIIAPPDTSDIDRYKDRMTGAIMRNVTLLVRDDGCLYSRSLLVRIIEFSAGI